MAVINLKSKFYRGFYFTGIFLEFFLVSGILFGWPNIVVVFKDEGLFSDLCPPVTNATKGCNEQIKRFDLLFTMITVFTNGISLPAGFFVDRYGAKAVRSIVSPLFILACLAFALVKEGYEDWLFPAFVIMASCSKSLVVSSFQVANIMYGSLILCILSGAFDSSSVNLLFIQKAYESGISRKASVLFYTITCTILLVINTILTPSPNRLSKFNIEEESKYIKESERQNNELKERKKNKIRDTEDYSEPQNDRTLLLKENSVARHEFWQITKSRLYLLDVVYLCTFGLTLLYFAGTVPLLLRRITTDHKTVANYVALFGYFQLGGIIVTPIIGIIFDKDKIFGKTKDAKLTTAREHRLANLQKCLAPFLIIDVLVFVFGLLSFFHTLQMQIILYALYITARGFLYSNQAAYIGAAFPSSLYGRLFGLADLISAAFGLLQYPFVTLTVEVLNKDPFWVNCVMMIFVLLGCAHTFNLWWYCRKESRTLKTVTEVSIEKYSHI